MLHHSPFLQGLGRRLPAGMSRGTYMSLPLGYEGTGAPRHICGAQQMERPTLFNVPDCSIKDPPSANVQSPCSKCDFKKIDKYVERARALKDALIGFDEVLLEQWEDYLQFHREGRLNQDMFAGPHGSPVTESNLQVIEDLAEKLSELAVHHEELKAQVEQLAACTIGSAGGPQRSHS